MTQQDRLIGRTLGRYRIEALIGRGGLATVYRATDLVWDLPVAVKILPDFFASDEEHRQRFQREASTMANLVHPNLMPVRDYDQVEGITFFVMDYAPGGTLDDRLGRPMSPQEALVLLEPIAAAVAYAHSQQVIHRDLKPSNILFDAEERPLITDFGIAKLVQESGLTQTRESLGTPEYMAPEQAREAALVAAPADVYALGVIIFQMLVGQAPYQGNTAIEVIEKHKYAAIPSIQAHNPRLPAPMDEFFRRVLAKEPAERVQSVSELMSLFEMAALGQALPPDPRAPVRPVQQTFSGPAISPTTPPHTTSSYETGAATLPKRGLPGWAWGAIVGVAFLAIAVGMFISLSRPRADTLYKEALRCERSSNWACCVETFDRVLEASPGFRDSQARRDECQRQRELETAWKEITRCGGPEAESVADLRCVYENAGKIVSTIDPSDVKAQNRFADAGMKLAMLLQNEEPDAALRLLQEVEASKVPLPNGYQQSYQLLDSYAQGQDAFARSDWAASIKALTPIADFRDGKELLYVAHVRLCQEALKRSDLLAADAEVRAARKLQPDGQEAQACTAAIDKNRFELAIAQAEAALAAKRHGDALTAARTARELRPDDATARDLVSKAYQLSYDEHLAAGKWQEAISVAQEALAAWPGDPQAQAAISRANDELFSLNFNLGQDLIRQCRLAEAVVALDTALGIRPGDATATNERQRAVALQQPDSKVIADSYNDWSSQPGRNGWYYLARVGGGVMQNLGWGGDAYYWNRGEGSRITREGQHPGVGMEAVRRWQSTITGQVTVQIDYRLERASGRTYLYLNKDGQQIWSATVSNTNGRSGTVGPFSIAAGSNLDLILNPSGSQTWDYTFVRMRVTQQVSRCTKQ